MSPTEDTIRRVGADGDAVEPREATDEVIEANIPGDDPAKFVTLTLSNPLTERDRQYLGLPLDASTEVGQKVRVNKNGAKAIINAGYATIDPEDNEAVRTALRGDSAQSGEPTADVPVEAPANPAMNPPKAKSTPATVKGQQSAEGQPAADGDGGSK